MSTLDKIRSRHKRQHPFVRLKRLDKATIEKYVASQSPVVEIKIVKPKNIECPYCEDWFSNENELYHHKLTIHKISKKKLGQLVSNSSESTIIQEMLFPDENFKCPICCKSFPYNAKLKDHIDTVHHEETESISIEDASTEIFIDELKEEIVDISFDLGDGEDEFEDDIIQSVEVSATVLPDSLTPSTAEINVGSEQVSFSLPVPEVFPTRIIDSSKIVHSTPSSSVCRGEIVYSTKVINSIPSCDPLQSNNLQLNVPAIQSNLLLNSPQQNIPPVPNNLHQVKNLPQSGVIETENLENKVKRIIQKQKRILELESQKNSQKVPPTKTQESSTVVPPPRKFNPMRKCPICQKTVPKLVKVSEHIDMFHTVNFAQKCLICKSKRTLHRLFHNMGELQYHQNMYHGVPYPCNWCTETFAKIPDLFTHLRNIHGKEILKNRSQGYCETCKKGYTNFKLHFYHVHQEKERKRENSVKLVCPHCGLVFTDVKKLRFHEVSRHKERTIPCDQCDKLFPSAKFLREHKQNTHTAETWPCSQCSGVFANKRKLKRHQKSHEDAPMVCDECGQTLSNTMNLYLHKRIKHRGVFCTKCGEQFFRPFDLLKHKNEKHKKIVMFDEVECDQCGKKLKNGFSLRNHVKYVHEKQRNAECDVCGLKFTSMAHVKRHKLSHARGDDPKTISPTNDDENDTTDTQTSNEPESP